MTRRSSSTAANPALSNPTSNKPSGNQPSGNPVPQGGEPEVTRSHREVIVAMSGLLLGMFVAILAGTVVATALPHIISDLHGGQAAYTWVVTASLLATTVTTPVWGKFADLFDRKLLIQLSLIVFVVGSALCGFAQDPGTLIAFRVVQGVGAGGLMALVQIVMADIVSPRERGKYMGLIGAVLAVGTVGGPLLGGLITDAFGWRWIFYIALPVAVVALIVLQKTLHIPPREARKVSIDYLGTALLAGGTSLMLVWVSLAGTHFDWLSTASALMIGGSVLLLVAFVFVELHATEPIIPMSLFRSRTFTLIVLASIAVGVGMFGATVYLTQYMQMARGASPTLSGLLTFPLVAGLMVASAVVGALISSRGKWKGYMVSGGVLMTIGLLLLGSVHYDTSFWLLTLYMIVLGSGIGMVMQNLVLIVQNDVDPRQIGAASSGVAFFRTLGGTIGVSGLGGVLANQVADDMGDRQGELVAAAKSSGKAGRDALETLQSGNIPDMTTLPDPLVRIVEPVFGTGIASLFWVAAPLGLLAVLALAFLPNKPLGNKTTGERLAGGDGNVPPDSAGASPADSAEGDSVDGGSADGEELEADRVVDAFTELDEESHPVDQPSAR